MANLSAESAGIVVRTEKFVDVWPSSKRDAPIDLFDDGCRH